MHSSLIICILIAGATLLLLPSFVNTSEASKCKDIGLYYGNSAICWSQGSDKNQTKTAEPTVLRLFDMRGIYNEGSPVVFVGKLATESGDPIPDAVITITHDGACQNKVIGSAKTDVTGRYMVYASARIWDEKDNLIKATANFAGKNGYLPSVSISKIIVVYPLHNEGC